MRPSILLAAVLALSLAGAVDGAFAQGGKRFARTDTNGDGKISLQEFIAARGRIFERIDANHDGVISPDEIAAASQAAEAAEAGRMIRNGKQGGGRGQGQLARLQKMAARGPVTRQIWDQMMTRRFDKLDVQHVGFITMDQMRPHRAGAGETEAPQMSAPDAAGAMVPSSPSGSNMAVPMATKPPHG